MPARNRSKKPPAAPKRKRMLHALYMAQPFLQFFALMAVFFVLGRCSPLSPSSDKSVLKNISDGVKATPNESGENAALEQDIKKELREISDVGEMPVQSQSEYSAYIRESIHADKPADSGRVKHIFQQRSRELRRLTRMLVLPLSADEKAKLLQGSVRIDLSQRLSSSMDPATQKLFFALLRDSGKRNTGKAILVLSDEASDSPEAVASIPLHHKVRLAVLSGDEKAYLQVSRVDDKLDDLQQELIRSNLERSVELAVVLE
jgi:hypothetical protein